MNDDLASGFQNVDSARDFAVFSGCLALIESMPFFVACKRASYRLLGAGPGRRVLDVGCGLGDDAAALAALVEPGGTVVGVDSSQAMIDAARRRFHDRAGQTFEVADAAALPFEDARFDACRIDRVLQHIPNPATAIRDMVRVLRPGGVLVAYDNDWETLAIDAPDRRLTRTILHAWCDRFPSGWIGRQLVPLCQGAGLVDVHAWPRTLIMRQLDLADRLYSLFATAEQLVATGTLPRDDADRWIQGLRDADATGHFFSTLTAFLVRGRRADR